MGTKGPVQDLGNGVYARTSTDDDGRQQTWYSPDPKAFSFTHRSVESALKAVPAYQQQQQAKEQKAAEKQQKQTATNEHKQAEISLKNASKVGTNPAKDIAGKDFGAKDLKQMKATDPKSINMANAKDAAGREAALKAASGGFLGTVKGDREQILSAQALIDRYAGSGGWAANAAKAGVPKEQIDAAKRIANRYYQPQTSAQLEKPKAPPTPKGGANPAETEDPTRTAPPAQTAKETQAPPAQTAKETQAPPAQTAQETQAPPAQTAQETQAPPAQTAQETQVASSEPASVGSLPTDRIPTDEELLALYPPPPGVELNPALEKARARVLRSGLGGLGTYTSPYAQRKLASNAKDINARYASLNKQTTQNPYSNIWEDDIYGLGRV